MKTLKTIFAAALTAVVLTSTAVTTFAAEPTTELATKSAGFNKIWVSGNVKIVLTQGDKEGVSGTESYDAEKTSVTKQGQTLYINSMEAGQVTLKITVKDLQRVEAYGESVVVTSGNFDVKYLQLFLSQRAKAKVSATAGSLYTVINDDAVLKMSGAADQHTLIASNMKNVKFDNFASLKTNVKGPVLAMAADSLLISKAK